MDAEVPQPKVFQQVLDDHKYLKELLARIGQALSDRSPPETISAQLNELADRLVQHFALEEEGGYFTEAVKRSPHLSTRAEGLMAQHGKLQSLSRQLAEGAQADQGLPRWWTETRTRFDALRESLLKHESGEDSFLLEAYNQDLGAND